MPEIDPRRVAARGHEQDRIATARRVGTGRGALARFATQEPMGELRLHRNSLDPMKRTSLRRAAFTLLEIMLVVLIIGLLIGMAIKFTAGHLGTAQTVRVKGDIGQLKTHLLVYQANNGLLATTEQGLKALIGKPASVPKPRHWPDRDRKSTRLNSS